MFVQLNTNNFGYFAFNPNSPLLTEKDQETAKALTVVMGIFTLGLGHLISGIVYAIQKPQMTDLLSKIDSVSKDRLGNNNGIKQKLPAPDPTSSEIEVKSKSITSFETKKFSDFSLLSIQEKKRITTDLDSFKAFMAKCSSSWQDADLFGYVSGDLSNINALENILEYVGFSGSDQVILHALGQIESSILNHSQKEHCISYLIDGLYRHALNFNIDFVEEEVIFEEAEQKQRITTILPIIQELFERKSQLEDEGTVALLDRLAAGEIPPTKDFEQYLKGQLEAKKNGMFMASNDTQSQSVFNRALAYLLSYVFHKSANTHGRQCPDEEIPSAWNSNSQLFKPIVQLLMDKGAHFCTSLYNRWQCVEFGENKTEIELCLPIANSKLIKEYIEQIITDKAKKNVADKAFAFTLGMLDETSSPFQSHIPMEVTNLITQTMLELPIMLKPLPIVE